MREAAREIEAIRRGLTGKVRLGAVTGAELIDAMKKSYPQVTDGAMSLDIGAKVNKGEMKW